MAGLNHSKPFFARTRYSSFADNANWDLKGLEGEIFRGKVPVGAQFFKMGTQIFGYSAVSQLFEADAPF